MIAASLMMKYDRRCWQASSSNCSPGSYRLLSSLGRILDTRAGLDHSKIPESLCCNRTQCNINWIFTLHIYIAPLAMSKTTERLFLEALKFSMNLEHLS